MIIVCDCTHTYRANVLEVEKAGAEMIVAVTEFDSSSS